MEKTGLVILLSLALSTLSSGATREYHYVQLLKTWTEAQSYCRENFADLATIETVEDWARVKNLCNHSSRLVWIGLYDDVNGWRWSMDNTHLYGSGNMFGDWFTLLTDNYRGIEHCVEIFGDVLNDCECETSKRSVCYDETSNKYIPVMIPMTWSSAQSYCREKYTDLASMRNQQEKEAIMSVISYQSHWWVGLSRDAWKWSDHSVSLFRVWWYNEPSNNNGKEFCACKYEQGWADYPCDSKMSFICSASPTMKLLKLVLKPEGSVDLNDPQVQEAVLKHMEKSMRDHKIQNFRLSWTKQPNGKIFNKRQVQL